MQMKRNQAIGSSIGKFRCFGLYPYTISLIQRTIAKDFH